MFSLISTTSKKVVSATVPRTVACKNLLGRNSAGVMPSSLSDHQRCYRSADVSSNSVDESNQAKNFFPVYVHHVSKIVLEHLQESRADWLIERGLDRGLYINPNGTFAMHFPARKGFDSGRIWTSYDTAKKQHWLSVYRQKLAVRFLLKDHGKCMNTTKVHDATKSEAKIKAAVDQMILSVNQIEQPKSAPTSS